TLDFVVQADGNGNVATGLRVELKGTVGQLAPNTKPSFLTQPQVDQTVLEGDKVQLAAAVRGSTPLTYQWKRNGSDVPGATSAILVLDKITEAQEGTYQLVASNSAGSATSDSAHV